MDSSDTIRLVLFLGALLMSALFSATEAAFLSIQRGKLAALLRSDPETARKVERFASSPEKLLSTVLTGNNLANTGAAALGTGLAISLIGLGPNKAVIASTVGVTLLLLVFAEAIPKTIATRHSIGMVTLMARPLRVVELILLPPIWLLERVVRAVTRVLGLPNTTLFSQEELLALVDMGRESGVVQPVQAEMLGNVFRVEDRQLKEVMTPRTEMIALRQGATLQEFFAIYQEHSHTRYPVFAESIDNITGILSLKDVVTAMGLKGIDPEDDITQFAQPAMILPETKMLGEFLRQLDGMGHQMIILADEYGGVAGLVTLKEMVEEIVGPMGGHGDLSEDEVQTIDADTYEVDGGMDIDDANKQLGLGIPEGDYETIAGYILSVLGVIPTEGDQVRLQNFLFEVIEMQGIKIGKVRVSRNPAVETIFT